MTGARRNKYGAKKVTTAAGTFDSQAEHKRWVELSLLERAGVISGLIRQPVFKLNVNGMHVARYTPDFQYIENGKIVVEDVKGYAARDFPIRSKLFQALNPDIRFAVIKKTTARIVRAKI